jgi:hypothetical protein
MGVEEGVRFSNPVETERDMIVVWVWCIQFSCSVTLQQHLKFVVCKRFGFEIVEKSGMRGYNYKLSSTQPCE